MSDYELGQAIFGAPTGEFECPNFVHALLDYLLWRIGLVVWNRDQKEWSKYEDPKIDGLEYRTYCWDDESPEAAKPNFKWRDAEIRWYKYPGRGMSVNVDWTPQQWVEWFDTIHDHLHALQHAEIP